MCESVCVCVPKCDKKRFSINRARISFPHPLGFRFIWCFGFSEICHEHACGVVKFWRGIQKDAQPVWILYEVCSFLFYWCDATATLHTRKSARQTLSLFSDWPLSGGLWCKNGEGSAVLLDGFVFSGASSFWSRVTNCQVLRSSPIVWSASIHCRRGPSEKSETGDGVHRAVYVPANRGKSEKQRLV